MSALPTTRRVILITGGAGFIGGALARALVADPETFVVIVDDLSTGYKRNLPSKHLKNWAFVKCDVNRFTEIQNVFAAYKPTHVFHYAAVVGVERTLRHPLRVLCDIDGIRNICELAKSFGVRRVFFASSSEVYGEPVEIPQNEETTPLNARLPYAVVKNVGEVMVREYGKEFGFEYTILRFFNTYGPGQREDFVITRFLRQALEGKPITVYGDGMQTRTFCYIDDATECTLKLFYEGLEVNSTINVGSDEEISIRQLAQLIKEVTQSPSPIVHLPPRKEGDMRQRLPDISKMLRVMGRKPIPLREGLIKLVWWYKKTYSIG